MKKKQTGMNEDKYKHEWISKWKRNKHEHEKETNMKKKQTWMNTSK